MKKFLGDGLTDVGSYRVKRDYLTGRFGSELDPMGFYRELYPEGAFEESHPHGYDYSAVMGSGRRPNGLITEVLSNPPYRQASDAPLGGL